MHFVSKKYILLHSRWTHVEILKVNMLNTGFGIITRSNIQDFEKKIELLVNMLSLYYTV